MSLEAPTGWELIEQRSSGIIWEGTEDRSQLCILTISVKTGDYYDLNNYPKSIYAPLSAPLARSEDQIIGGIPAKNGVYTTTLSTGNPVVIGLWHIVVPGNLYTITFVVTTRNEWRYYRLQEVEKMLDSIYFLR